MTKQHNLDTDIPLDTAEFLKPIRNASEESGKSPLSIVREIAGLCFVRGGLEPAEYFKYRLYRKELSRQQCRSFIGKRSNYRINAKANCSSQYSNILNNKLLFESLLRGFGFEGTKTLGMLGGITLSENTFIRALSSLEDLTSFLEEVEKPIFCKPNRSSLSLGSLGVASFEAVDKKLHLTNGTIIDLDTFFNVVHQNYSGEGYLFQEHILPNNENVLDQDTQPVGTVRLVTTATSTDIDVLYAVWKIPARKNMADNYWRIGNALALICPKNGNVERVIRNIGNGEHRFIETDEAESDGIPSHLPQWENIKKAALCVADIFSDTRVIGFDVAITAGGPKVVEANTNPDHGIYQIVADTGFLSNSTQELFGWNYDQAKKEKNKRKLKVKQRNREHTKRKRQHSISGLRTDLFGS